MFPKESLAEGVCSQEPIAKDLTQKSQNTQKNIVSQDKQSTLDENSQNLHDASPVRHPDEGFDLTQKAQNARIASLACGLRDEFLFSH